MNRPKKSSEMKRTLTTLAGGRCEKNSTYWNIVIPLWGLWWALHVYHWPNHSLSEKWWQQIFFFYWILLQFVCLFFTWHPKKRSDLPQHFAQFVLGWSTRTPFGGYKTEALSAATNLTQLPLLKSNSLSSFEKSNSMGSSPLKRWCRCEQE